MAIISILRFRFIILASRSFSAEDHGDQSTSTDPRQWVGLAVVQSYNLRRKVPRGDISTADLEVCLAKASFSAAQYSGRMLVSF